MKKILVPVDFSSFSENAVDYALKLCEKIGGEIRLMHAYYDPYIDIENNVKPGDEHLSHEVVVRSVYEDEEKKLSELFTKAETFAAGHKGSEITCSYVMRKGFPDQEILHEAASWQPTLILMGAHGHSAAGRMFFGSVTQELIRNAHFPILALPHKYKYRDIMEVVYLTNFSPEDEYSIGKLINLFSPYSMHMHITHYNLDDDRQRDMDKIIGLYDRIHADYKDVKLTYDIIDSREMTESNREYIVENHIDIIALTTRKMNNFHRLFHHSAATEILYHSDIPLIVFHEP